VLKLVHTLWNSLQHARSLSCAFTSSLAAAFNGGSSVSKLSNHPNWIPIPHSRRRSLHKLNYCFKAKVKVNDIVLVWPTVSRPVCLCVRHPSGTSDQCFFFLSLIVFRQLRFFFYFGRPLWREVGCAVCRFCRASPAQPFPGLTPTGLMSICYCLYFWDSPNLEG
jgi:hypothetical protein